LAIGYRPSSHSEPETSLHPELLEPLARTIARAAQRTQIWVVTHSDRLADALAASAGVKPHAVIKRDGGTWIEASSCSASSATTTRIATKRG
jgi:predicted ATPase